MKKIKVLFGFIFTLMLMAMLCITALGAESAVKYTEGLFTYTVSDGKATVVHCDENAKGDVVIPDTLGGYEVTAIANNAFRRNGEIILNITIPETVTNIESKCFYASLEGLKFSTMESYLNIRSNGNAGIWDYAEKLYIGGELITDLVIPEEITTIPEFAFSGCKSITSVTIPSTLKSLGRFAFKLPNLKSVHVDSIEAWLNLCLNTPSFSYYYAPYRDDMDAIEFYVGGEILKHAVIPESIKKIPHEAFYRIETLESLTITSAVEISNYAFMYSDNLENIYVDSLETWLSCKLDMYSLSGYNYLYIGAERISHLVIPEGIKEIPDYAFYEFYSIKDFTLPESLEKLGINVFPNVRRFHVKSVDAWINSWSKITANDQYSESRHPMAGANSEFYVGDTLLTDLVISESVTKIARNTFYNMNSIKTLTLKGPVEVDQSAFSLSDISEVHVDSIDVYLASNFQINSFSKSYDLYVGGELVTDLVIPEGVTKIPDNAFYMCKSITSVTIPESMEYIGCYSFCSSSLKVFNVKSVSAWVNTCSSGLIYSNKFYSNQVDLYINGENATELIISEGITSIPKNTFCFFSNIKSVILPDSLESIGEYAFGSCQSLESVTFPTSLKSVENSAFLDCYKINSVHIPSVESWLKINFKSGSSNPIWYGGNLYVDNAIVEKVVIPEGVETISAYAFYRNTNIKSVTLPKTLTSIGANAFFGCEAIENVHVPSFRSWLSIKFSNVYSNPMYYADELYVNNILAENIIIPEGTKSIPDYAFYSLNIKSVTIPESVEEIGKSAFYGCETLEKVYISSVESWLKISFANTGANPLYYAGKLYMNNAPLENIVIPAGTTNILRYAFCGLKAKSLTLPESLLNISGNVFSAYTSIEELRVKSLESFLNVEFMSTTSNPLTYAKSFYINNCLVKNLVIPENTVLKKYTFYRCRAIDKITIPASCRMGEDCFSRSRFNEVFIGDTNKNTENNKKITDDTFGEQFSFKKLTIGYGIKGIYYRAFEAKSIGEIVIYDGLEVIDYCTFANSDISSIIIPNSVTLIGESAFADCKKLKTVTFGTKGSSVQNTVINKRAFDGCTALTSIIYNSGIKKIHENVFCECPNLTDLYINGLASYLKIDTPEYNGYGSLVGYNTKNIYVNGEIVRNLVIPEGVKGICSSAFQYCKTLETVKFPSTLEYIGVGAFRNCPNLKNPVFPESLKYINEDAFFCCSSIKMIEIPASVKDLGMDSFGYCRNLEVVIMNESLISDQKCAFDNCENLKQILYSGTEQQWEEFLDRNPEANLSGIPVMYNFNSDEFFAPQNIKFSSSANSVVLNWSSVKGASGYRVYVKNSKTGSWDIAVKSTGKKASATLNGLESGNRYTYAVRTYINTGTLILWSPEYSTINTVTKPVAPGKVSVSCVGGQVNFTWSAVKGATGYRLFLKQANGWKSVKTTGATSYTVSGHKYNSTYTYAVRAYTKYGGEYYWAPSYTTVTFTVPKLNTTALSVKSNAVGKVNLSWKDVSGETGYQIWYSESATGLYKKLSNYSANTISAVETGLKSGNTYYFKIRAYKAIGGGYAYGAYSSAESVKVK